MMQTSEPTISILYFAGCPNHEPAVSLVESVVRDLRIDARIEGVELLDPADADRFEFLGSPTIRVDGIDIEPAARARTDYGFACRTFAGGVGVPERRLLEAALEGAARARRHQPCCSGASDAVQFGAASGVGSALTAILASACCWLPLVLIGLGVSSAGVATFFFEWRPWFLTSALALLAAGFGWTVWRGVRCNDERERRALRLNRAVLWASAVLVGLSIFAPNLIDRVLVRNLGIGIIPIAVESDVIHLRIGGMHCATCAISVQEALAGVDGVERARVEFDSNTAQIEHSGDVSVSDLIEAVEREGFLAYEVIGSGHSNDDDPTDQGDQ